MATKVYLKGVNVFIDDGNTIKRIPSGYTVYELKNNFVYIYNLISDSSKSFPVSDLQDESGGAVSNADDYLSEFIGAFKKGGAGSVSGAISNSKPYIYEVDGKIVIGGGSQAITVKGFNFNSDTVFEIVGTNAVIDSFTINNPEEATINITPSAVGTFELRAKTGSELGWNTPIQITVQSNVTTVIPGTTQTPWINQVGTISDIGVGLLGSNKNSSGGWNTQAQFLVAAANTDFELFFDFAGRSNTSSSDNSTAMVGISTNSNTTTFYSSIDYGCFYINNSVNVSCVENGRSTIPFTGIVVGDTLSIKRVNGLFSYYKNGVQLYASTKAVYFGTCYFDCSIYQNIKLTNIRSEYV